MFEPKRETLQDLGYENLIVVENPDYDDSILGVSHDDRVVYDYDKMLECLIDKEGMDLEAAMDFISYDTIRSIPYAGENAPVVMFGIQA